jgi:hypothetical protein
MSATFEPAPTDFDFMIGDWMVRHKRLKERLVGCTDWTEFTGTSSTRKILRGYGNVEDNVLHFPEGSVHATAIRSFDPKSNNWAIWWLDGRAPHHLDVPVVGKFSEGVGAFYAEDKLDEKPILVRFLWHPNPGSCPRWEQAFSPDEGKSWEVNWIMHFARFAA